MKDYMGKPLVSIIIPVYNSQRTIRQCLVSVKRQTYKRIETIVVDNLSVDETVSIVKQFNTKVLVLKSERSVAKNFGARGTIGNLLLFIDSDMELTPKTVEECVNLCVEQNFDAIVIPETTVAIGFLANCRKLERELYDDSPSSTLMPRFFKKDAFFNVNGFDERLVYGEDFDLARRFERKGYRIGTAFSPIKHLEGEVTLKKIVLKANYYGRSLVPLFSTEPKLVLRTYSPIRFALNIKRLLATPDYLMGLAVIKLFEYVAYLTGIFTGAVRKTSSARGRD